MSHARGTLGKCAKRDKRGCGETPFLRNILSFSWVMKMCQKVTGGNQSGHFRPFGPCFMESPSFMIDELVKSQKWEGKVKNPKCKACESKGVSRIY